VEGGRGERGGIGCSEKGKAGKETRTALGVTMWGKTHGVNNKREEHQQKNEGLLGSTRYRTRYQAATEITGGQGLERERKGKEGG